MSTNEEKGEALVHFNPTLPCGIVRTKGILLSGDVNRVTCSGCKNKEKAISKKAGSN